MYWIYLPDTPETKGSWLNLANVIFILQEENFLQIRWTTPDSIPLNVRCPQHIALLKTALARCISKQNSY